MGDLTGMKQLTRDQYYIVLAYYMLACRAQKEVQKFEKMITDIIGDGKINDAIYDSLTEGGKEDFDKLLLDAGIEVDWKPEKKDFDQCK